MAAADITYGLQRLRANNNTRACFWVCCYCPNAPPRFDAARQYQRHLEQCHEEVQVDSDGRPLPCSLCQHGVCSRATSKLLVTMRMGSIHVSAAEPVFVTMLWQATHFLLGYLVLADLTLSCRGTGCLCICLDRLFTVGQSQHALH